MEFIVYILHSKKLNKHYIGFTENLSQRLEYHLKGNQSRKFTCKADDWELFLVINCSLKNQALQIEKHIKSMKSRVYIENLKKYPEMIEKLLLKYFEC